MAIYKYVCIYIATFYPYVSIILGRPILGTGFPLKIKWQLQNMYTDIVKL